MVVTSAQSGQGKPLLYHGPPMRSARVFWLLRELGVDFDVVPVDLFSGEMQKPEYLAVNPSGTAPSYRDAPGTPFMFESGAIVEFILAKYGNGRLVPTPGSAEHAVYLQFLWFAEATVSQTVVTFLKHTALLPEEQRVAHLAKSSKENLAKQLDTYEQALNQAGAEYLVPNMFSAADIMAIHGLYLVFELGKIFPLSQFPKLSAYYERITARSGYKEAYTKSTPDAAAA